MPLTREQKQKIVEDLKEKIKKQKILIFVDFSGLKVKDLFDLRKKLKSVNAQLKVVKKTLAQLAFGELKLKIDIKELKGEIALVFGFKDEISPAKIVWQFSQENPNLKILAGFFEKEFKTAEEMINIATLPTREEILTRIVQSISAPISNLVNVLEGNLRGLVFVLSVIKK